MATNPTYRLSVQAFPQSFDGANVSLRILIMPQGDPLSALLTGVSPAPDSPAFADANVKFVANLIPSLADLPAAGRGDGAGSAHHGRALGVRSLFQQLATQFTIVPNPPGQTPRRIGYSTRKYLPDSYRNAFNFDRPEHAICAH